MNILITYSNDKYRNARFWCSFTGKHIAGFDKVYAFGPEDIDNAFKSKYSDILKYKRGNGLWLWKPYFIDMVLKSCSDGDIIFYCDSGACFKKKPLYVYQKLKECPMFCCDIPLIESNFTKPECFLKLRWADTDEMRKSNQIIATFFALRVCKETKQFVREWLDICCDIEMLSPSGTIIGLEHNYGNSFVSHREDQSLFSLLCKKYGYNPHRDISQRGLNPMSYFNPNYTYKEPQHDEDKSCPTILWLHKSPKLGIIYFGKYFLRFLRDNILKIIKR